MKPWIAWWLLLLPCVLRAQYIQTVSWAELGKRADKHKVTLTLKSGEPVQGKVVGWDSSSLSIRAAGADRQVSRSDISLVRVSPRRGWTGRIIGFGVGAGAGVGIGVAEGGNKAGKDTGMAALAGLIYGGIGYAIGWGVDALRSEKTAFYRVEAQ